MPGNETLLAFHKMQEGGIEAIHKSPNGLNRQKLLMIEKQERDRAKNSQDDSIGPTSLPSSIQNQVSLLEQGQEALWIEEEASTALQPTPAAAPLLNQNESKHENTNSKSKPSSNLWVFGNRRKAKISQSKQDEKTPIKPPIPTTKKKKIKKAVLLLGDAEDMGATLRPRQAAILEASEQMDRARILLHQALATPRSQTTQHKLQLEYSERLAQTAFCQAIAARRIVEEQQEKESNSHHEVLEKQTELHIHMQPIEHQYSNVVPKRKGMPVLKPLATRNGEEEPENAPMKLIQKCSPMELSRLSVEGKRAVENAIRYEVQHAALAMAHSKNEDALPFKGGKPEKIEDATGGSVINLTTLKAQQYAEQAFEYLESIWPKELLTEDFSELDGYLGDMKNGEIHHVMSSTEISTLGFDNTFVGTPNTFDMNKKGRTAGNENTEPIYVHHIRTKPQTLDELSMSSLNEILDGPLTGASCMDMLPSAVLIPINTNHDNVNVNTSKATKTNEKETPWFKVAKSKRHKSKSRSSCIKTTILNDHEATYRGHPYDDDDLMHTDAIVHKVTNSPNNPKVEKKQGPIFIKASPRDADSILGASWDAPKPNEICTDIGVEVDRETAQRMRMLATAEGHVMADKGRGWVKLFRWGTSQDKVDCHLVTTQASKAEIGAGTATKVFKAVPKVSPRKCQKKVIGEVPKVAEKPSSGPAFAPAPGATKTKPAQTKDIKKATHGTEKETTVTATNETHKSTSNIVGATAQDPNKLSGGELKKVTKKVSSDFISGNRDHSTEAMKGEDGHRQLPGIVKPLEKAPRAIMISEGQCDVRDLSSLPILSQMEDNSTTVGDHNYQSIEVSATEAVSAKGVPLLPLQSMDSDANDDGGDRYRVFGAADTFDERARERLKNKVSLLTDVDRIQMMPYRQPSPVDFTQIRANLTDLELCSPTDLYYEFPPVNPKTRTRSLDSKVRKSIPRQRVRIASPKSGRIVSLGDSKERQPTSYRLDQVSRTSFQTTVTRVPKSAIRYPKKYVATERLDLVELKRKQQEEKLHQHGNSPSAVSGKSMELDKNTSGSNRKETKRKDDQFIKKQNEQPLRKKSQQEKLQDEKTREMRLMKAWKRRKHEIENEDRSLLDEEEYEEDDGSGDGLISSDRDHDQLDPKLDELERESHSSRKDETQCVRDNATIQPETKNDIHPQIGQTENDNNAATAGTVQYEDDISQPQLQLQPKPLEEGAENYDEDNVNLSKDVKSSDLGDGIPEIIVQSNVEEAMSVGRESGPDFDEPENQQTKSKIKSPKGRKKGFLRVFFAGRRSRTMKKKYNNNKIRSENEEECEGVSPLEEYQGSVGGISRSYDGPGSTDLEQAVSAGSMKASEANKKAETAPPAVNKRDSDKHNSGYMLQPLQTQQSGHHHSEKESNEIDFHLIMVPPTQREPHHLNQDRKRNHQHYASKSKELTSLDVVAVAKENKDDIRGVCDYSNKRSGLVQNDSVYAPRMPEPMFNAIQNHEMNIECNVVERRNPNNDQNQRPSRAGSGNDGTQPKRNNSTNDEFLNRRDPPQLDPPPMTEQTKSACTKELEPTPRRPEPKETSTRHTARAAKKQESHLQRDDSTRARKSIADFYHRENERYRQQGSHDNSSASASDSVASHLLPANNNFSAGVPEGLGSDPVSSSEESGLVVIRSIGPSFSNNLDDKHGTSQRREPPPLLVSPFENLW